MTAPNAPPHRLDATGAFRLFSANLWKKNGYDDDRTTVRSVGKARQAPDGGAQYDGGRDVRGGDDGSLLNRLTHRPTPDQ